MSLELNEVYSGFVVKKITPIKELNVTAYEMYHDFSGAKLLFLETTDDNKVFTIGFRTPSQDDTGVAHITEHSVLCGSRKYHLKEPFVELVKGSLNTFLNAMTYSDKTLYPVASRNKKDFKNLMDVYLDAVFYPLIYENPFTLMQEGWHYEIDEATGNLKYNGVVYNEMKGVYSSYDAIEENECYRELFPQSPYRFDSGGFPDSIHELTQEKFEAFHKKYYSPENSYIYLYGDMDIQDTLAYIDKEYLQAFPKTGNLNITIPLQEPFTFTKEKKASYPIGAEENTDNKTYLSMNIVCGVSTDTKTISALKLLTGVLLDGNSAPLRLALLEAGICSDVSGNFSTSQLQPVLSIQLSGSDEKYKDKFVSVLYKTLQDISIKGIDKELIEASLNVMEFKLREADFGVYPKGLIYGLSCMETWLYGSDPIDGLKVDELLSFLRAKLKTNYYESLIENYLLDNTHKLLLTLVPEKGLEEKHQQAEAKVMAKIKAQLQPEDLKEIEEKASTLHERQAAPDLPKDLASIPILERKDITREVEKENVETTNWGDTSVLYLPQFTNKIVYYNWDYDLTGVPEKLMPYMYLLTDVLGKMNTKEYSYKDLPKLTNKYTGGVSFDVIVYMNEKTVDKYSICFSIKAKVLVDNIDKLLNILSNVALTSDFSDKKRLKEILDEIKTDWDSQFFNKGLNVAISRLASSFSAPERIAEYDKLSYYEFIKDLVENFEAKSEEIQGNLALMLKNFFHKDKQLFAYSCDKQYADIARDKAKQYMEAMPHSDFAGKEPCKIDTIEKNQGIVTSGKVQYVVAGGNFQTAGFKFTGAMRVLETILRYDYLWTKIRIQGGAYGANARFTTTGEVFLNTYRDPQLKKSLDAFQGIGEFLKNFTASDREMTKYVIGTISGTDVPLTNAMHLARASLIALKDVEYTSRQKHRDEILNVTEEDIRNLAPVLDAVLKQNYYCVVGSNDAISTNKDLFTKIIKVN